jgi:uncharacterized protein YbaR (Trm112 family)
VGEGQDELLSLRVPDDYRDAISFHRWFAMRGTSAARAAVAFTTSPDWLSDPDKLALMDSGDDATIASAIIRGRSDRKPDGTDSQSVNQGERLLDLCAGTGTVGAMAARLGFNAVSVEFSIVPHLIDRVLHEFAVSLAEATNPGAGAGRGRTGGWRGFATEVEDFANAVWRGAKQRLGALFEENVDVRLWLRIVACPSCKQQLPILSNVRLSRETALNVTPDTSRNDRSEPLRFRLLRTEFPDGKGTFAHGTCTCPSCHHQFRFRGYDLIPLPAVPVAVRMRDSNALSEIDAPDAYVAEVDAAASRSLAASSRSLHKRAILADEQPIFHDARGEPIRVRNALLPSQRAYFAALAESMDRESKLLAERATLTDDHRLAVRSAVALLISAQIDDVNTFTHSLIDKPHPSTFAGHLRLTGLFTEVGGYWLERSWRSRLRQLLNQLQENSSIARPVQVIHASAANVPQLDDSSVSAVVWDPPYYDNIDYDTAGEPYQAILAAMAPDLVSELVVPPTLPLSERTKRHKNDLLRQAREARRVVSSSGRIGVFWLARERTGLQDFLEMIAPVGLELTSAVRLSKTRTPRGSAGPEPQTYLLVLKPIPVEASAVVVEVDTEKVLALATVGTPSLYDGLAELLESAWDPAELDRIVPGEFRGSSRQRLVGFLASHREPEQLLVELGRMTLLRELLNRDAVEDELHPIDSRGLAQRLLAQLGFAVARPVKFSIRAALHDCGIVQGGLELANSIETVRGSFLTCCSQIERILRYSSLAWSHLACGDRWNEALAQTISPSIPGRSYPGPDKLTFGQYEFLFTKLPAAFAHADYAAEKPLFSKIERAIKKAKLHEKLSALVALRNAVEHDKEATASLSLPQLRQRCRTVLGDASAALADIDSQQLLPLTVRPEEERRDRYGRRVLRLLDPDDVAIEAYVASETDLTEPLIYFAYDNSRRHVDPKFISAAVVEELLGLA